MTEQQRKTIGRTAAVAIAVLTFLAGAGVGNVSNSAPAACLAAISAAEDVIDVKSRALVLGGTAIRKGTIDEPTAELEEVLPDMQEASSDFGNYAAQCRTGR